MPWPVVPLPLFLPSGVLNPGTDIARDARCAGVGSLVMSSPISAVTTAAAVGPTPGISSSRATVSVNGATRSSICASSAAMSAAASIRVSLRASRKR